MWQASIHRWFGFEHVWKILKGFWRLQPRSVRGAFLNLDVLFSSSRFWQGYCRGACLAALTTNERIACNRPEKDDKEEKIGGRPLIIPEAKIPGLFVLIPARSLYQLQACELILSNRKKVIETMISPSKTYIKFHVHITVYTNIIQYLPRVYGSSKIRVIAVVSWMIDL